MRGKHLIAVFAGALILFALHGSAQQMNLCSQGPVNIKKAGGTWFISIAGGEWQHVGQQWEKIKTLIAGSPIEEVYKRRRILHYAGSVSVTTLGLLLFFWPSQLCALDKEVGIRCQEGLRLVLSPLAALLGGYWLMSVEEIIHVSAIKDYNEMWQLVCQKP